MLLREKLKAAKLSPSEKTIADFMLAEPENLNQLTVQELAKKTFTHPSTFIRLAKKMDFEGWLALREAFLEEWQYLNNQFTASDWNLPFSESDGVMSIAKKLANLEQATIEDTYSLLHHDQLQQAKQFLLLAKKIRIFATSGNSLIAQDFILKMNRLGFSVALAEVNYDSFYEAYNLSPQDCAILISYSGESNMAKKLLPIFKKNQVPVIAITTIGNNYLADHSDAVLRITTREKLYSKIGNFSSNTSIVYLLDLLYAAVFSEHYQKNLQHLITLGQAFDTRTSDIDFIKENQEVTAADSWIPN
ncbi:MurR/RpiR family transcriptional regulator [Enterococcus sp. LJL120]